MHSLEMIKYLNREKPQQACPQCKQPVPQDKGQDTNRKASK